VARRALLAAVAAVLCAASLPPHVAAQDPDTTAAGAPVVPADAYADARTRELVQRARTRRAMYDARIRAYSATAVERISASLRAGIAERLVYRRETASRIDWTLDTVRVEVLGARDVVPMFSDAIGVPPDLERYMPRVAFDPVDSGMMLRLDSSSLRHPLAEGSEAHYRFEAGDSTVITLPDGRAVRLHELRILPRRRDPHLIVGSFWIDAATDAVVQAYFRQSRGYQLDAGAADDDDDECGITCRLALAVLPDMSAELDHIAIDYGLWDLEWWMPRVVTARGVLRAGRFTVPVTFERRYSDYTVEGDPAAAELVTAAGMRERPCRPGMAFTMGGSLRDSAALARHDSITAVRREEQQARRAERIAAGDSVPEQCDRTFIVTHAGAAELLDSDMLPASIYADDSGVLSLPELEAIAAGLRRIPSGLWQLQGPGLRVPSDLRYNRVEGASAAVGMIMDFGRLSADAELGIGTGDRRLRGEVGVTRPGTATRTRIGGYSRLASMEAHEESGSLGRSLNALLLGRDEHEYFRAAGVELIVQPVPARTPWYDLRLFAERQAGVEKNTDFSVRHLINEDHVFRPNSAADPADQLGATLHLRTSHGLNPRAVRWAAELELHGEIGDYAFTRPGLRLNASQSIGPILLATEVAGGSNFGDAPAQRDWLLGGSATLRGYPAASIRGAAFWRARAELGTGLPFFHLYVFGDAGHAGPRRDLFDARPLRSAGVGLSLLDGLVRIDVARPLDGGRWRLHAAVGRF
jgi:hypothetical protein